MAVGGGWGTASPVCLGASPAGAKGELLQLNGRASLRSSTHDVYVFHGCFRTCHIAGASEGQRAMLSERM